MEFNPNNPVIQLCMQGMAQSDKGQIIEAGRFFLQAWNDASNNFEKFIAAYYMARHQTNGAEKLAWLQTAIQLALELNTNTTRGALPSLYSSLAECYENTGDEQTAANYRKLATSSVATPVDAGPFYHGTKADLKEGDFLTAGYKSNYKDEVVMNHIYFTALLSGAGLAAELAKGDASPRVYMVDLVGEFEDDPNVTNKRFPGNPTRSYRTVAPLKVIGEVHDWTRLTPDELKQWRQRLANSTGEIIN